MHSSLYTMIKDPFGKYSCVIFFFAILHLKTDFFKGNYVAQKLLDIAEPPQRKMLLQHIRPYVAQLRKLSYGTFSD
jgi:hypothetical protein